MFILNSAKKAAIAAVMVAPMLLVACGSDEEASDATAASSATSSTSTTANSAAADESSEGEESTSAQASGVTSEVTEPSQELAAEIPEITFAELPPVEGGQPASAEDSQAIESLIRGTTQQTTVRSLLQYPYDNLCSRVLAESGGDAAAQINQLPDIPLSQAGMSPGTVDSVTDIVVDGDAASAWVVATGNGQTESATQRFLREDGRWKFCD